MTIKRFKTNKRMSQAVVHGGLIYTAGQVAMQAPGESVTRQTEA
ncbi:MAG: RidA family protein, partial [Gammaproteobacteria bacterium]